LSFEHFSFDPRIGTGIKALGYTTPTPIQQQAIPAVLKGHDVLGVAQTGTGKQQPLSCPFCSG
jgi:superfamily II DNA/RNA helicase